MNEWIKRGLWGLVFVAVTLACTYNGFISVALFTLFISSVCLFEYLKMIKQLNFVNLLYVFVMNLMLLGLCEYQFLITTFGNSQVLLAQFLVVVLIFFLYNLIKNTTQFLAPLTQIFFANVYISVPFLLFLKLQPAASSAYDWRYPMLVFFLVWSSDTFAYIAGRLFGKRPLFKVLSPKKTLEGFAGGALLSCATGILLAFLWNDVLSYTDGVVLSILVAVFGTMGDLAESALKRHADIKDSGKILPGHGGALDRFDAFILASVVVYVYFALAGRV